MQEIIIDGVNLNDLKQRFDAVNKEIADIRKSIRQGASKFISDNVAQAKKLVDEILGEDDDELEDANAIDSRAEQAFKLLSDARFVSQVADVTFDLPYYDRQSEYAPYGEPYSNQIEDSDNKLLQDSAAVDQLYGLLESMESDVSDWNTSYC